MEGKISSSPSFKLKTNSSTPNFEGRYWVQNWFKKKEFTVYMVGYLENQEISYAEVEREGFYYRLMV